MRGEVRGGSRRGRAGERGFTLMEILIAMTVLMIGLLPMMAVFKTALMNLNRAIEDTYASAIAQSVIDAVRVGLKDVKVELADGRKFFIFDHEGSEHIADDRKGLLRNMDITNPANAAALLQRDYVIELPKSTETEPAKTGTPLGVAYLYPKKNGGANARATYVDQNVTLPDGTKLKGRKVRVEKVYQLGKKLTESAIEVEQKDTLSQYSFAFTIRGAKAPDALDPKIEPTLQNVMPGLYEVVVKVFRNFHTDPNHRRNDTVGGPGREFITYVAE